jgi:hypothetical protein
MKVTRLRIKANCDATIDDIFLKFTFIPLVGFCGLNLSSNNNPQKVFNKVVCELTLESYYVSSSSLSVLTYLLTLFTLFLLLVPFILALAQHEKSIYAQSFISLDDSECRRGEFLCNCFRINDSMRP